MVTHTIPKGVRPPGTAANRRTVLIFSPDAALARTLVLNLEEKYSIVRETSLPSLAQTLAEVHPDVIVVDLFTFSEDVNNLLIVLREKATNVPVVTLRGYIPLRKDINVMIEQLSASVFYKPVDVDLVSEVIENFLTGQERNNRPAKE